MTAALAAALLGLALLDSTSFGTLLIPIWLLLTPGRVRAGPIARYLAAIALFYFAAGIALAAGANALLDAADLAAVDLSTTTSKVTQLVAGVAIVALSYWLEARARRRQGRPGKLTVWRERAMTDAGRGGGLTRLAIIAAGLETATMVPYLAAIGLLANADVPAVTFGGALAVYCLVMVLPAIVLTVVRLVAHDRVAPVLHRINEWFQRNSAKAIGWIVGGIGIGIAVNAVMRLLFE